MVLQEKKGNIVAGDNISHCDKKKVHMNMSNSEGLLRQSRFNLQTSTHYIFEWGVG
jgi:hypothetical protein